MTLSLSIALAVVIIVISYAIYRMSKLNNKVEDIK